MNPYWQYLISIFCLSQSANLVKWANAPVGVIGFWRLLLTSLILLTIVIQRESASALKVPKNWIYLLASSVFLFLHLFTYKYSAVHTSIANCMILFSLNPLSTALISILFFKEKISGRLAIAYALAFGALILLFQGKIQMGSEMWLGNLAGMASALLFSVYLLLCRATLKKVPQFLFHVFLYFAASLLFFGSLLVTESHVANSLVSISPRTALAIAGLILLPTLLGHTLFNSLLKKLNVSWMSCGKLVEPMFSSLIAFFLFQEVLPPTAILPTYAHDASKFALSNIVDLNALQSNTTGIVGNMG